MLSRRVLSGCCCCCSWDRNGKGTSSLIAYAIGQRTLIVGEGSLYSWPPVDQQINHCTAGLNHCTAGLQLTNDENTHRWGRFTVQLASSLASLDLTNSDTSPNGEVLCLGPWLSKVHFIKPPPLVTLKTASSKPTIGWRLTSHKRMIFAAMNHTCLLHNYRYQTECRWFANTINLTA